MTARVIIVNWNRIEDTLRCLASLEGSVERQHIIVVDNGSSDGSTAAIRERFPEVGVLALPRNEGFARACNRGISLALREKYCEYILLLNNDTIVHREALERLLAAARLHPRAGILGPKIYSLEQPDLLWSAGARRRRLVLAAADTGHRRLDEGQFDHRRKVDYIFGAAMLLSRELLEDVGFFDERFFLYLEDLDLCMRSQAAGYENILVPQAHLWHVGSASTHHDPTLRIYHLVRSSILFVSKHTNLRMAGIVLFFWSAVFVREVMQSLYRGQIASVRAYFSGLFSGVLELVVK